MKLQELRIGNFIGMDLKEYTDNYFSVTEIGQTIQVADGLLSLEKLENRRVYSRDYYDFSNFEGIPLTKEWIINLGGKNTPDIFWISITNLKSELHFEFYEKEIVCSLVGNSSHLILDPIKYVHQLQNLYYALTGRELLVAGC